MPRKLPPLNALRAFEAAGRYLSFTGAAEELRVTQSAVSRHVGALEDWLGVKLFFRRQRGIELTARGEAYFRSLSSALDQIDHATRRVRDNADETLLRLKLPPTFALRWLAPRLALQQYWQRQIELAPPQIMTLAHLSRFADVASALHSARQGPPALVAPEPFDEAGERVICYPGDPRHSVPAVAMPGPTRLRYRNQRFEPEQGFEALFD